MGKKNDSERKYISLFWYLFHDLGGHPAGGAHKGVAGLGPGQVPASRQPGRHAEIGDLDLAVVAEKDVTRLFL